MMPQTCVWRFFFATILPSRFSHWDLFEWRCSSFFCCLLEIFDFQDAAFLSSVCRSLLSFETKGWGATWTLTSGNGLIFHAKSLRRVTGISSPKPFLDELWRLTVRLQRSLAEMHTMESLLRRAECRKNTKNSFRASCSGPLRAAKNQKNHQDSESDGQAVSKDTFFFNFGSSLLDRFCSSSLVLLPPPFTVVKETCQPVLPVYTCKKQAKNQYGIRTPLSALQLCIIFLGKTLFNAHNETHSMSSVMPQCS